jgi:hypothetical protein
MELNTHKILHNKYIFYELQYNEADFHTTREANSCSASE